ncbi:hypothetical protein DSO57_1009124 [Entomophthora muscae]|uniref:Uncharacterized protein n=1 Tax=Entomophthora muscae TaxID=34485 RepID=A0ACC2TTW2_9FUNG|nr:hypothetical protein DSO57_1009124 [Entomophthora muscae]
MSFVDLEAGLAPKPKQSNNSESGVLQRQITQKIFKISSSTSTLRRIVDQLGTPRDTQNLRKQLHDVTESTREIIKDTKNDLKVLASQTTGKNADELRQSKLFQQKLTKDFQKSLEQFHSIQRLSAEKSREVVDYMNMVHNEGEEPQEDQPLMLGHQQRIQLQALDNEIDFNHGMIEEREREIREIEQGITELNEVFRDLGTFVNEQQGLLDNIESNVTSIAVNTQQASSELRTANNYQKKSRNTMCFIFALVSVITIIFLLIIIS